MSLAAERGSHCPKGESVIDIEIECHIIVQCKPLLGMGRRFTSVQSPILADYSEYTNILLLVPIYLPVSRLSFSGIIVQVLRVVWRQGLQQDFIIRCIRCSVHASAITIKVENS